MGDTGPCGPCSEIFFDHGDKIAGGPPGSADADGDRFIEIWNLVFMQFEQRAPGTALTSRDPSIDTGMGLERVAAVLQGKHDNYDIDLFQTLIRQQSAGRRGRKPVSRSTSLSRRAARHRRSLALDELPHRRRRAAFERGPRLRASPHHAPRDALRAQIGRVEPLMYHLVPALVREMGDAYPELVRAQPLITETLKLEENEIQADAR